MSESQPPDSERVYVADGRSFSLRAVAGNPGSLRVTRGKGRAMLDVIEPERFVDADIQRSRERLLARLELWADAHPPVTAEPETSEPAPLTAIERARQIAAWVVELDAAETRVGDLRALIEGAL